MKYKVRFAKLNDKEKIFNLYKQVAKTIGGIAREESEISIEYILNNLQKSIKNGVCMVVENPNNIQEILAEIHCYKLEPHVFNHLFSELTIVVRSNYQNKGIGKLLFSSLLTYIEENRNDILRVELIARESNEKAISFYEKLGFVVEGKLEKRIKIPNQQFEADIPMAWFNKNYSN